MKKQSNTLLAAGIVVDALGIILATVLGAGSDLMRAFGIVLIVISSIMIGMVIGEQMKNGKAK